MNRLLILSITLLITGTAVKANAQRYLPDSIAEQLDKLAPKSGQKTWRGYAKDGLETVVIAFGTSTVAQVYLYNAEYRSRDNLISNFKIFKDSKNWRSGCRQLEYADPSVFDFNMRQLWRSMKQIQQ